LNEFGPPGSRTARCPNLLRAQMLSPSWVKLTPEVAIARFLQGDDCWLLMRVLRSAPPPISFTGKAPVL
jgi:hypothetical protein